MAPCQLSIPLRLKYEPLLIVGKILLLGCGPLKGDIRFKGAPHAQLTVLLAILTDRCVDVRNLFVCACHHQGVLSFDSELAMQLGDRLTSIKDMHLAHGSQFFQFDEALLWGTPHHLDCFPILRIGLALYPSQ